MIGPSIRITVVTPNSRLYSVVSPSRRAGADESLLPLVQQFAKL